MTDVMIGGKSYSADEIATLAKAGVLNVGEKHDTSATTPSSVPMVGPLPGNNAQFGAFGAGVGPRVGSWNATAQDRSFLQSIPWFRSDVYQEVIDVATGVTAGSGNNVTGACAVGPKPGSLKAARITSTFGMVHLSTKIFDLTQAGMRRSPVDTTPELFNAALIDNPLIPQVPGITGETSLASVLRAEMLALGTQLNRVVGAASITGVAGTQDNTWRGIATQWDGLDALIKTGWTDVTGVVANALDAAVVSFNANADGGTDSFSRTVVGAVIDTYVAQVDYLNGIGITPEFALVMRPDLFRALAAVWSCTYQTTRCTSSSDANPTNRNASETYAEYVSMLNGRYLNMEGVRVPVILDTNIPRDVLGNGYYKSDIYGIALRGNGRPVIYGEYFDMGNPQAVELANFAGVDDSAVLNGGLYRVFRYQSGGCLEYDFIARPRIVTDAPFMHFRIDDLFYRAGYSQHDAKPGMSFHVNGGLTYRT